MKCLIWNCILKCITNNSKPPQNFDFQKTELSFRFILFEKFSLGLLFLLCGKMEPIVCLLFYLIINMEVLSLKYFCQKSYQTLPTSSKNIQENIKMLQQGHTKRAKYNIDFQMNTHSSLHPPNTNPFFEGGNEISKKLGRGNNSKKICRGNPKKECRGNAKVIGR